MNKKAKYILSAITLTGLVTIPTAIALTSCSIKPQEDKIIYDTKAEGATFTDANGIKTTMSQEETPFYCDFNLTNKTCTIVTWIGGYPNYMTKGLPDREGLDETLNKTTNNTIRIPSQVKYNNEYYQVVAFSSFNGAITNKVLSFNNINPNYTQVIEFDVNLRLSNKDIIEARIGILSDEPFRRELLKVLNFPDIGFGIANSPKLEEFTFNPNYKDTSSIYYYSYTIGIPSFLNCPKLKELKIPNGVEDIGLEHFKDCTSLESITIPNTVTEIFNDAFTGCTSLKSLTIPDSVKKMHSIIYQTQHPPGFKIYFYSQETMDLFIKYNYSEAQYCELLPQ